MTALWIILGVIGAIGLFALIMYVRVVWINRKMRAEVLRALEPVLVDLRAGRAPRPELVQEAARNPRLRNCLYIFLMFHKRTSLFPKELANWESIAESELVDWLCHPNELGCPPDQIELMHKIAVPAPDGAGELHCFLFRYRTREPHWCAHKGWLAGVTGPIDLSADPVPGGLRTFSRFEAYDSRTPQEHVDLFYGLIGRRPPRHPKLS